MAEKQPELKCPICPFRPRNYRNDDPKTAKDRLYAHIHLNHRKEELIRAIFILAGYEEKKRGLIIIDEFRKWPPRGKLR